MRDIPIHVLEKPQLPFQDLPPFWQVLHPPARLYIQSLPGSLPLLDRVTRDGLAVVGTRDPQNRSRVLVRDTIRELKGTSLIVVSGFARGIDSEAHAAALDAGLPTIAILGTGTDRCYPKENGLLRTRILESGGLLVSEFAPGIDAQPWQFIRRNRLIACWSQASWVVEASYQSGALNTARWARDQHRTTFATPCFPDDPVFLGTQDLIDRHQALPFWGPHSLGEIWKDLNTRGKRTRTPQQTSRPKDDLEELKRKIEASSVAQGGATVEELLQWALERQWDPQRFFFSLQRGLEAGMFLDEGGTLVAAGQRKLPLAL